MKIEKLTQRMTLYLTLSQQECFALLSGENVKLPYGENDDITLKLEKDAK